MTKVPERKQQSKIKPRITYIKSVTRMFSANIMRLFAISIIIAIGISLLTGLSALPEQMRETIKISPALDAERIMVANITADKIELLAFIFPAFFIAVATLTALTTMTRLVEEERPITACLKTIGYSNTSIIIKFVIFAFVCCIVGCTIGLLVGNYVILPILFNAASTWFDLAAPASGFFLAKGVIYSVLVSLAVILTAFIVSYRRCMEKPASLLRPKTPKAGGRILLERVPIIWNRFKFKYKSSIRNIFRYKGRLVMTILSVGMSTMMLFCGFGLYDSLHEMKNVETNVYNAAGFVDSIVPIAVAIIVCAVALAVLVLFNLTNINIEERRREIATLKVLGYNQMEVAGYIYREIMILSTVGIIIGTPIGYLLLGFIFEYIGFGSLDYVKWYIWFITIGVAFLSVLITDVLLYRKIDKIDMSTSLKTVE